MKPLVSILMPVYNGALYLRPALESILRQKFSNFELIVVNDGSTDNTVEIVMSYNDERIILVNQENQGVATALNNGLKKASGKYIRRHDADDVSLPDDLKIQVEFLEKHPEFALVSSQIAYMTDRGKKASRFRNPKQDFFAGKQYIEIDYQLYIQYRPVIHATVLMRRDALSDLGGYRKEFLTSEDIDLWLRFLDHHRIAVLNHCRYFVRLHHTSATRRHSGTVDFYRDLAFRFAEQRRDSGTDDLAAGNPMPMPERNDARPQGKEQARGRVYREDLIFYYNILVNAKDMVNLKKTLRTMITDGWRVQNTWKMILFPWIGTRAVKTGVAVKSWFSL